MRQEFLATHPGAFFLETDAIAGLQALLRKRAVLDDGEELARVTRAGDGNMNCTVRAETTRGRSLVVKQARPWVEKYPQFPAPRDRALREMEFYRLAGEDAALGAALPTLLHADEENRLLVLEDLGTGGDCSDVYGDGMFTAAEVAELAAFLSLLHRRFQGGNQARTLENREMRQLNHAHIFVIPFQEGNGLDLDAVLPGMAEVARPFISDPRLAACVRALGAEIYLAPANACGDRPDEVCLLHGDFFPGSFLRTPGGLRIIDPEFCFGGRPEFDSGVFLAHLALGRQLPGLARAFLDAYAAPSPRGHDERLMLQLAGVEILRRLTGYAQLPLAASLDERRAMLEMARALVLEPDLEILL